MNIDVTNMGAVLAAIVTVSLALTQAIGPLVMYLTEAIKATGKIRDGWSGLVALIVGVAIGSALGWLTDAFANESYGTWAMVGLGAFAGAMMAAGAVKTYKAVGEVNTKAMVVSSVTIPAVDASADPEPYAEPSQTLGQADMADVQAVLDSDHGPVAEDVGVIIPTPPLDEPTAHVVSPEDVRK